MTDKQLPPLPTPKFTETIRGVPCITVTEHEHLMREYALQARPQVQSDPSWWMRETDEGAEWTDTAPLVLSGWTPLYTAPQPAQATQAEVTDSMIREAFLTNGFTIKDGHSDLKPYVYAAARALLALQASAQVQATQPAEVTDEQIESCALEAGFSVESTGSIWAVDGLVGTRVDPGLRKFARAILAQPAEGGEPYYGHQFKEIRKGVWLCKCGKQITEGATSCTNGTPNTSTQQQTADAVNATLTHADSCCAPRAQGWSIREGSSQSDTSPASQEQAQQPIKDHQIAQIVNQLRGIAIEFGGTQQLRERIAGVIVPVLKAKQPAPGVPDDVVRDAISTVREHYRGTDWGKAAESICDAIDAAMLAAKDTSGLSAGLWRHAQSEEI